MNLKQLIEGLRNNPGLAEQKMKVKLAKAGPFKVNVKAGSHKLIFDEEKVIGGTNEGPAPALMLLAAMGGCVLNTMQVWSQLLNIPFNNAEVSVKGKLNLFGMTGIDDTIPAGFQNIVIDIKIESEQPEEQLKTLIEKVERHCPVVNTITNLTEVKVKIKRK
ncbi:MAG: OsmC family protein [Candidatus Helarchaeota archaeon]